MAKTLELANVKLGSVVSNIMGVTGRAILDAMIRGEQLSKTGSHTARWFSIGRKRGTSLSSINTDGYAVTKKSSFQPFPYTPGTGNRYRFQRLEMAWEKVSKQPHQRVTVGGMRKISFKERTR